MSPALQSCMLVVIVQNRARPNQTTHKDSPGWRMLLTIRLS